MVALALALTPPACSRTDAPVGTAAETDAPEAALPAPSDAWEPDDERKSLPASRIYYTLTDYEWYARGEPLLHEGVAHVPIGLPIAASVDEMEKVGVYQGVDFYRRRNETEPVLYVPVFEGYWQIFRAAGRGSAAKVAGSPPR